MTYSSVVYCDHNEEILTEFELNNDASLDDNIKKMAHTIKRMNDSTDSNLPLSFSYDRPSNTFKVVHDKWWRNVRASGTTFIECVDNVLSKVHIAEQNGDCKVRKVARIYPSHGNDYVYNNIAVSDMHDVLMKNVLRQFRVKKQYISMNNTWEKAFLNDVTPLIDYIITNRLGGGLEGVSTTKWLRFALHSNYRYLNLLENESISDMSYAFMSTIKNGYNRPTKQSILFDMHYTGAKSLPEKYLDFKTREWKGLIKTGLIKLSREGNRNVVVYNYDSPLYQEFAANARITRGEFTSLISIIHKVCLCVENLM